MYDLIFVDKAKRQLKKLERTAQLRIIKTLERIRVRPEVRIVKLIGDPGYKLRVGDYRIILDLDQDKLIILVLKIGHRRNIYK